MGKRREVPVVRGLPTRELPCALDRIEFRTVGREKLQREARLGFAAPVLMQAGMMVRGIVEDDNDTTTGVTTDLAQVLKKREKGVAIELGFLPVEHKFPVS